MHNGNKFFTFRQYSEEVQLPQGVYRRQNTTFEKSIVYFIEYFSEESISWLNVNGLFSLWVQPRELLVPQETTPLACVGIDFGLLSTLLLLSYSFHSYFIYYNVICSARLLLLFILLLFYVLLSEFTSK